MKRVLLILSAIVLALMGAVFGYPYVLELSEPMPTSVAQDQAEQVSRGQYLALAGNCAACHTVRGGVAYTGGRVIETPFGQVLSSNLTPDPKTGLGDDSLRKRLSTYCGHDRQ